MEIDDDGSKVECWYNDSNKLHREDGPAVIGYYKNGTVEKEYWFRDDKRHREDGPAEISYREDGTICHKSWYKEGKPYMAKEKSI